MRTLIRRASIASVVLVAVLYIAAGVWLRVNEKRIIYLPHVTAVAPPTAAYGPGWERVTLTAADGVRLSGVVVPADDPAAPWVLDLHGNAGSIWGRLEHRVYDRFHDAGLNVLAVDYRGYGTSDARPPDEMGLYADARGIYTFLLETRRVPAGRVIIYGHSLGAGPATELATQVPAAGLVLEGAFTTVGDLGAELYWWLPVRWITTQRFANVEKIGRVRMPKLLMHAVDDEVIPYPHGRRLFAAASEPKQWADLSGGHNDARGDAWRAALGDFVRGLGLASR